MSTRADTASRTARLALAALALLPLAVQAQAPCVDDAAWQALQAESARHGPALLYVWSPRMVLSAVFAHQVRANAQRMGLRFVPLHDGRLPPDEVLSAIAATPHPATLASSRPLCAPALIAQDAYRHFPTSWVLRRGSAHPDPIVAAMPPAYWRRAIAERLPDPPAAKPSPAPAKS